MANEDQEIKNLNMKDVSDAVIVIRFAKLRVNFINIFYILIFIEKQLW